MITSITYEWQHRKNKPKKKIISKHTNNLKEIKKITISFFQYSLERKGPLVRFVNWVTVFNNKISLYEQKKCDYPSTWSHEKCKWSPVFSLCNYSLLLRNASHNINKLEFPSSNILFNERYNLCWLILVSIYHMPNMHEVKKQSCTKVWNANKKNIHV